MHGLIRQYGFMRAKVAWNFIKGVLRLKWGLTVPVITFVVQSLSRVQLFVTLWMVTRQASLSFTISWSLLKLISIELVMPSNHLILCHPLLLLPSIFPSIGVFSNVSSSQQVAKILEFQDQSFQWIFRIDFLSDWLVWSPCCPADSQESSPTLQFKSINSSAETHRTKSVKCRLFPSVLCISNNTSKFSVFTYFLVFLSYQKNLTHLCKPRM